MQSVVYGNVFKNEPEINLLFTVVSAGVVACFLVGGCVVVGGSVVVGSSVVAGGCVVVVFCFCFCFVAAGSVIGA